MATVPDTVPAVVRIDHTLQVPDTDIAVHLPDTLPVVPDIPAHMVGRMTPAVAGTRADMAASVGTFVVAPSCFEPNRY